MAQLSFDYYDFEVIEPHKIEEIYSSGFKGVIRNDFVQKAFFQASQMSFYDAFPQAAGVGEGKLALPYKAALSFFPNWGSTEAQTTGDCVSHSTRNAGEIDYFIDAFFGETKQEGRFATENIYGYRGHGGQGASCSRLAEYVSQDGPGGFLVRKVYSDGSNSVDLSKYNSRIGHNWGSRGTPSWVNQIAANNKALRVLRCRSLQEARDALACGFGLSRCGWWGYSSKRNADGVSDVSGRWSHAMAIVGSDHLPSTQNKYKKGLFLDQNSWGMWNSGPKRHEQPDGSYWYTGERFEAEIKEGGVYVIASVRGFNRELVYDTMTNVLSLSS